MIKNNNSNKSMLLYTALIFVVALLLILLSFFGQTNLEKNQPEIDTANQQSDLSGISERASVLSEENKALIEENNKLKEENQILTESQTENEILLSAYGYYSLGANDKALEMLLAVNYDNLSADQKIIYDTVNDAVGGIKNN